MRYPFGAVNVVTMEHSNAYVSPSKPDKVAPEITIPGLRARLSIEEARSLRDDLTKAIEYVESWPATERAGGK